MEYKWKKLTLLQHGTKQRVFVLVLQKLIDFCSSLELIETIIQIDLQTNLCVHILTVETIVQTYLQEDPCVPVSTIEIAIQTDLVATGSKIPQTEDVPHYTPVSVEAIIQKLKTKLEDLQQVPQQHQKEVVPLNKYQGLLKKVSESTTIEDESYASLRVEQKKVEKVQGQYQKALEKTKIIFSVYSDVLAYRFSTTNYALFLLK